MDSTEHGAATDTAAARAYADGFPELVRFVTRLVGDSAMAEDLAQEAGMRLLAEARRGPVEHPRAFLFHVATNLARDHLRRRVVADTHARTLMEPEPAVGADVVASAREEVARASAAIARLPKRPREVLLLARVQGLSQKEIAAKLGVTPKTVENHLTRALGQLAALMRSGGRQ
jgi:RNA polymerase sigma factor (sigma-70 family)